MIVSMEDHQTHAIPAGRTTRLVFAGFAILTTASYALAALNLYLNREMSDGQPGLTQGDVVALFHGEPGKSRMLLQVTEGSMKEYLPPGEEGARLVRWLEAGGPRTWTLEGAEKTYEADIQPILEMNCVECHHPSANREEGGNPSSPFQTYEEVARHTAPSEGGMPVKTLAWVSHIHLFAIGFAFFVYAMIAERLRMSDRLRRTIWIFSASGLLVDVGGWWLTRLDAAFAPLVQIGGGMVGFSFLVWGGLTLFFSARPRTDPRPAA